MQKIATLNGLVLAGGQSRRMGSDKGLIVYHERPQREHLFAMLQSVCNEVHTSCRSDQHVLPTFNPLPDAASIQGPLNGILSAFAQWPDKAWLAVAVDLPNLTVGLLRELVVQRMSEKPATCFFDAAAQAPEPLLTIWEPAAYPLLIAGVEMGNISPRSFLLSHDVHVVHGMDPAFFHNVNDQATRSRWSPNDPLMPG